jgi:hypothetical protein
MRVFSTKNSSRSHKRFLVSIYLADEAIEYPRTDRLSIPLTRLFGGTVVAANDRLAAARAWIRHVGQHRHDRLVALRAPGHLVNIEAKTDRVANQLVPVSLSPVDGGFFFDNGVEVWIISVRQE